MSWSFETVVNTSEEAGRVIDSHKAIPVGLRDYMKSCIPSRKSGFPIFDEGISAIVKSNGHVDPNHGPTNFTFELKPINNANNGFYK